MFKKNSTKEFQKLFHELFQKYYPSLISYAIRWVEEKAVAEDIVQDLFLYLGSHKEEIDFSRPIKPYLYRSVYNKSMTWIQQSSVKRQINPTEIPDREIQEELFDCDLFDQIIEKNLRDIIYKLVHFFPEQRKNVFLLSREKGLKNREIAELLQISEKTVEKHIKQSLKTLRHNLTEMNAWK